MASGNVVFGGNISFDHRSQEWAIFKSRFLQFCTANNVTEETDKAGVRRRAMLLTSLVEDTYRVATDLVFPVSIDDIKYIDLVNKLDKHFLPQKNRFVERYSFYKAEQRSGEELPEWAARVRNLSQHCGFGAELDTALRDRFVLGLENAKEREKLFAEDVEELTFARALQLAQGVRCSRLAARAAARAADLHALARGPAHQAAPALALAPAQPTTSERKTQCVVCGYRNHSKDQCRFLNYTCQKCHKKGHLKSMCKTVSKRNNFVTVGSEFVPELTQGIYNCHHIRCVNGEPMQQLVTVGDTRMQCEVDSGSAVSVITESTFNSCFKSRYKLNPSNISLNCYNGSKIVPLGILRLPVAYGNQCEQLDMYVVSTRESLAPLLGRDFISKFNLQICPINYCNKNDSDKTLEELKSKYFKVFSNELGLFNKHKIHLVLKDEAKPIFFKPRPVALALRSKIEVELSRLVALNIIEKVEYSEYATPIVPVLKSDGSLRICGDFSVTLNKILFIDSYPLPRIEELFSKLHGGEEFTKLDLSMAYNQLELTDESKNFTCINTHKGLYRYNRLVFGLSSAPCIFQKTIEKILGNIEGVCVYIDDILITGPNRKVHKERLELVLKKLQDAGMRLKQEKCELFKNSIEYLGFRIDKTGLHTSKDKVKDILNVSYPNNVSELKSFLGMVNYYRLFVPNTSSILQPLHMLLQDKVKWEWGDEQTEAFNAIKRELSSERVLAHYDPALRTVLTVDAGPRGLGAVLAQAARGADTERVVAYASRSLSSSERNYSQIQKEAAAIIFGVKKFHHYLYGRSEPFILRTDHKPLVSIFGSKRGVPEMAANRLQRYALFLSCYNFKIEYIKSENNVADYLSRAGGHNQVNEVDVRSKYDNPIDNATYVHFIHNSVKVLTLEDVARCTARDSTLVNVQKYIAKGWPRSTHDKDLLPFFKCRLQLSTEGGCVMRGHKIVIPSELREQLLNELHSAHFGIVKTKATARSYMWWPHIDQHIEDKIGSCSVCNTMRPAPPRAPLAQWPYPVHAWSRVHLDMFSIEQTNFLVAVDAHSKWVECYLMQNIDSQAIISKVNEMFCRYGLVNVLVTDNASNFTSSDFEHFCNINGIRHLTIAPYHPASNGQAENTVKCIKLGIKAILVNNPNKKQIVDRLNNFLFHYRNTTHCSTGFSPAQLLLGRSLRGRLELLRPLAAAGTLSQAANDNVICQQTSQSKYFRGKRKINIVVGSEVIVKTFYLNGTKHYWARGYVTKTLGSRMFIVHIPDKNISVKKHVDQLWLVRGPPTSTSAADEESVSGETPRVCTYPRGEEQALEEASTDAEAESSTAAAALAATAEEAPTTPLQNRPESPAPASFISPDGTELSTEEVTHPSPVIISSDESEYGSPAPSPSHNRDFCPLPKVRSTRNKNPQYKF